MPRFLALMAVLSAPALFAQVSTAPPAPIQMAVLDFSPAPTIVVMTLPDAPSFTVSSSMDRSGDQAGVAPTAGSNRSSVAPKYAGIVLPGQTSIPLTAGNKVVYGFKDAFSPFALVGITVSAGYSHLVDSAPHYGTNREAFGKREGVAALRSTIQTLATDSLFAPVFHDDPRYYELGRQHKLLNRVVYAGTRVILTRSDAGNTRLNAPLLLGYGVAAGMNNLYYPDRDTGAKETFKNYAGSIGGAAIGMEVNEFLDDALRIVHLRK